MIIKDDRLNSLHQKSHELRIKANRLDLKFSRHCAKVFMDTNGISEIFLLNGEKVQINKESCNDVLQFVNKFKKDGTLAKNNTMIRDVDIIKKL